MSLNENIKLGVFDTLHDFWKERKLAKNDEEDEDNEPIDEGKQQAIRYELVNFLSKYLGVPLPEQTGESGKMINNLLKTISSDYVSSVTSNYERTVLKYYEEVSSLHDSLHYRTTESLRYGDIIESYIKARGNPSKNILLQKYINSNGSNYILELSCGDHKTYSSFGIIQKNPTHMGYIANFVLNYYYPGITDGPYNAYFTFDAKPGIVAKTFRDIPEIYQLVTPANIADSAVTTFKALNNRNEYFFPDAEWLFSSNYYTGSSVQLKFLRSPKGFSVTNQFGFSLQVETANPKIVKKFDFSSNQKQGPSVNYLVDLMVEGERAQPNVSSILNISKMASKKLRPFVSNGLLFDVKRGGDYEQVNFATHSTKTKGPTIFSTIDILCSLYARTLSQNTVWHNGEKMTLYRFPSVPIDPALIEFNNMKHKSIDLIQELEILQKILNQSGLSSDINGFMEKIAAFYTNGIFFDNSRKKGTPQMQSEVIINILIKIRLIDVISLLGELSKMINSFSSPQIKSELQSVEISSLQGQLDYLKYFSKIDDKSLFTPDIRTNVNTLLSAYENLPNISSVMKIMKDSFDLSPNQVKLLTTGENPLGLDYTFFTLDTFKGVSFNKFNVTGNYKEIKFSNKFYSSDLYNVLNKFERMVNSTSSRGSKNLYDKLHKMDYFTFINNLFQSYFSQDMAESVYNLMQSPTSDEDCIFWFTHIASELNTTLRTYQTQLQTMYPSISLGTPLYNIPASSGGSNTKIKFNQKGGAVDIVQVYELSDLLRLISGTAAQFVEGFITENFELVPPIDQILIALMVNYKMCKETLDEVIFLFSNGLMTLQNQQGDGYEYEPTPSEFELLVSLSHMYDPTGNNVDYFYINASSNFYIQFIEALEHQTPTTSSRSSRSSSSRSSTPSSTSSTGRGIGLNITRINDISTIYNTSTIAMGTNPSQLIPAEILNLLALTLIDNTMQNINRNPNPNPNPKIGYFYSILGQNGIPSVGFDSIPTWEKVMDYYHAYLYQFSRSNSNPLAFKTIIDQIKGLSGGKKSKTRKNRMKRKNTRKRR